MENCVHIIHHISRIQGQLEKIKEDIKTQQSCKQIIPLTCSAAKSFDGLKASLVEYYIIQQWFKKQMPKKEYEQLALLTKLIKS